MVWHVNNQCVKCYDDVMASSADNGNLYVGNLLTTNYQTLFEVLQPRSRYALVDNQVKVTHFQGRLYTSQTRYVPRSGYAWVPCSAYSEFSVISVVKFISKKHLLMP